MIGCLGNRSRTSCSRSILGVDRQAAELLKQHESRTLEFKSTSRWNLKENRKDPAVTNAVIKTIAAFLNTGGRRRSHWGFG